MNDHETSLSSTPESPESILKHELHSLRKNWWCLLVMGIVLILCGTTAISFPFLSTVGIALMLGVLLLIAGVSTIVAAFWAKDWGAFALQLIIGIIYALLGLMMADEPIVTSAAITMLVGAFAIVGGSVRAIAAMVMRFPQWGWVMFNGIVVFIFGVVIFRHFPESSLVVLGIMLGIDMIFAGVAWTMLSFEVRELNEDECSTD